MSWPSRPFESDKASNLENKWAVGTLWFQYSKERLIVLHRKREHLFLSVKTWEDGGHTRDGN